MENQEMITIQAEVECPIAEVWARWTTPADIMQWNSASDDWHTPHATVDLQIGGRFHSRMEAKDGSFGFDFGGVYTKVDHLAQIDYILDDGRKVQVHFAQTAAGTQIVSHFEPESKNPAELQQQGWQMVLDHFKRYTESR